MPVTMFALLRSPQQVVFGPGQRRALGAVVAREGASALVVTDARLAATDEFSELVDLMRGSGVAVETYAETLPDAPTAQVEECVALARRVGPDVVVAMGGGSCLDMAKASAVLLAHGGAVSDYYGEFRVPGPTLPVIALPTTAGTGSEVTPVAVLTDPSRTSKVGISSPHLVPRTAICDPELTYGCPPPLTASAGADALSHAIESFTAVQRAGAPSLAEERVFVGKNAIADELALAAVRLIAGHLHTAWARPDDAPAREAMMLGATLAGLALSTAGTAAAHAIQYPLGAVTHTPHGLGVGALLPYVMEFNRPVRERELAALARALGVADDLPPDRLAVASVDAVAGLLASVGVPTTLAELGLAADQLDWVAEQSLGAARLVQNNPRPLDLAATTRIVHAAYAGRRSDLTVDRADDLAKAGAGTKGMS